MPQIRQPTTRLLMDFLIDRFPLGNWRTNVPVGPLLADAVDLFGELKAALASRPWRPKVDAMIFLDSTLVLVEAKDMKWREGLTQLPFYRALLASTPELAAFVDREVRMWLVVPFAVPAAIVYAKEIGAEIQLFKPAWYDQRVQDLNEYWTPEATERRQEKKRLRELWGLE